MQANSDHKSHFDAKGPEQHHSSPHASASVVDAKKFRHDIRNPSTDQIPQRIRQPRLALPKPNDKDWEDINTQLDSLLDNNLSLKHINILSPQHSICILENTTYNFLQARYGIVVHKPPPSPFSPSPHNGHTGMRMLRSTKKTLRKCFMELRLSGLAETPDDIKVKRQWAAVTRKMNKLRVTLKKTKLAKYRLRAEKLFRRNPYKYAENLSHKSSAPAAPTFSAETAEAYFTNTYRDAKRNSSFSPLEGQPPPPPPSTPFNYLAPSLAALQKIVKKKRNKAAPGLNGLSYLPYKKCSCLLKRLHKIFTKVTELGEVPEE